MDERLRITDWSEEDRPREKLINQGHAHLSDAELMAILIGSGNRNETAVQLSQRILDWASNNLVELGKRSVHELVNGFVGIGEAKAVSIVAALELGRRYKLAQSLQRPQIVSPSAAGELLMVHLSALEHEEFWVLMFNRAQRLVRKVRIAQGGIHAALVDIRLILIKSLESHASAIIIGHNHPTGLLEPSSEDIQLTKRIRAAAELLDIRLLDHIVVGPDGYICFSDLGLL